MNRNRQNRKSLWFLFLLALLSLTFHYFSGKIDFSKGSSYEYVVSTVKAQECTTCSEKIIKEEIVDSDTEYIIYDAVAGEFLGAQEFEEMISRGEVLGYSSYCDNPLNIVDLDRKTCVDFFTGIHHEEPRRGRALDGQVNTEKINALRLTDLNYPLAFFLGQYQHINSNKEIAIGKPEYPSSGQSIPGGSEYLLKTLTPQQAPDILEASLKTEREPYEVTALLATDDAAEVIEVEDGCYLVENAPWEPPLDPPPCPPEVSTYDYNVGATNYLGANEEGGGFWRYQIPQRDNYNIETAGDCIRYPEADEIKDGLWKTCVTEEKASYFKGIFRATWSPEEWEYCTMLGKEVCDDEGNNCSYEQKECIQQIKITVYLSPIFGLVDRCQPRCQSNEDCNCSELFTTVDDAPCANAFLTYAYMGTLTPQEADERVEVHFTDSERSLMFLVLTRCVGILEYEERGNFEKKVPDNEPSLKCLWDATPTLMNYKLQRKDKIPDQKDFPKDFQDHWREVFQEISNSAAKYGL